ncbi:HEPN domain-containing protein [Pedobacter insulae]|uniref:HEPN domain-containing protein n=1 Tax=Pedobacter insulae TaxID=414048 RepID=A0A1I2VH02_9SPHI|nr:HEPN domain-containing protein [Pedobacter insulae]SFG88353.1 HEPN domain-containing protein [Pedobacter insulae]
MQIQTYNRAIDLAKQRTNRRLLFNCTKEQRDSQINYNSKSISAIISFISEVIPISYIFCSRTSMKRTDLIIVTDQYRYKTFDEIYTLLDFAILGHKNINCTVYAYGAMYDFLLKGHLYFSAICTPENCVYQSIPTFNLPKIDQIKCNELIASSSVLFNQNIHKALTFFSGARQFANESERTIAAFMLQQACELTYRSLLLSLRGKEIKCHDLIVLRKHLSHFVPTIIGVFDSNEDVELNMLTSIQEAYINARYDPTYEIALEKLVKAISASNSLIQAAQEIFNYHCQKVKLLAYSYS